MFFWEEWNYLNRFNVNKAQFRETEPYLRKFFGKIFPKRWEEFYVSSQRFF